MTTSRRLLSVIVPAAVIAASLACGHDAEQAPPTFEPVTSTTAPVQNLSGSGAIEVRGVVRPAREAFVSSRVMGPVIAVHVDAGAEVSDGQKLLEIQPEASEGQLNQAAGALSQAEAALSLAERNFHRYQVLHDEDAASDLELDMARMEYERAQGAVTQAEGAVRAASTVADESVVRAPFAGRVVDTLVEVGDLAAPGRPLVQVESTAGRQLNVTVRESDIGRIAVGQVLPVTIDARRDLGTLDGTVAEIVPSADPATHTFTVELDLPGVPMASGLAGRALIAGDRTDRLVVPASAVHRRGGLELVVVKADDGTARTRAVTTGRRLDDGMVEILSGLDEGESVATDLPGPVADGTPLEDAR